MAERSATAHRRRFLNRVSLALSGAGRRRSSACRSSRTCSARCSSPRRRTGATSARSRIPDRRDGRGRLRRAVVAALGRPDRAHRRLAAPHGATRLHRLRGQLHPPGLPGELAARRRAVPVPLPRRRLLRRRHRGRRAAAAPARSHTRSRVQNGQVEILTRALPVGVSEASMMRACEARSGAGWTIGSASRARSSRSSSTRSRATNWWYVLGSATLVAFIVQVVTGVALAFSYVPAPNSAYESNTYGSKR